MEVMTQFESQVPDPLGDQLPALLSRGRMAAPSVGIDLLVFIRQDWFKGPAMQVQLDHIAGSESVLRQVREEQFVDHAFSHELRNELVEELILIGGAKVVQNWTVIP
jgi:hypothetical protein